MPPRLPTESEYRELPAWVEPLTVVRERLARCEQAIKAEGDFGKGHAARLDDLEDDVGNLQIKRAHSEGAKAEAAKIRDPGARKLAIGAGAAGAVASGPLWELLGWLQSLLGG